MSIPISNNRINTSLSSIETAIAIIPPSYLHPQINSLRSLYDRSYKQWPAHINVLYPFVAPEHLESAVQTLRNVLEEAGESGYGFTLKLDASGNFRHRQNATIYLSPGPHDGRTVEHPETESGTSLRALEQLLTAPFEKGVNSGQGDGVYRPHLTVGQTSLDSISMSSLMSKAEILGARGMNWFVSKLVVLRRDENGDMQIVDEILMGGDDHWGLRAVLNINGAGNYQDAVKKLEILPVSIDDQSLGEIIEGLMPTREDHQAREAAIKALKEVLEQEQPTRVTDEENIPSRAAFPILLIPVGSYMMDVYDKDSDVDCLCLSTISLKTFFQVARQRIKKFGGGRGLRVVRFVNAKVPMLELNVMGIKMDLQYCQAPNLVEYWADVPLLPINSFMFDLPASTLKRLNAYRDADYLLRTLPNLKVFRLAHRFIKLWAKTSGIASSRFGYLGGFHITLLLARVYKLADADPKELTAAELVILFFDYYAQFNWAEDIVSDPEFPVRSKYQRFPREAMVLASIHKPVINVAQTATRHTAKALSREFSVASEALKNGQWDLKMLAREQGFLKEYQSFIKIDVQYWGKSIGKGSILASWVESRFPLILVDLNSRLPSIHARVWPQRFVSVEDIEELAEFRGFYLVGLSNEDSQPPTKETDAEKAKDRKRQIENKFIEIIRNFEELLRETPHYDTADSWIQVQHVGKSALGNHKLDDRDWGGKDGFEGDAGIEDDDDFHLSEGDEIYEGEDDYISSKKDKKKSSKKPAVSIPGKKLRPAADVMNRIRWDPSLDPREFVIGYEDRFLGTREMDVDKWKSEQTDLEFIPMHRVVYFKRKSDSVLVWDRELKKDLLFGSGCFEEGGGGEN